MGSLTRKTPVSLSAKPIESGPALMSYQSQPNDSQTRRIDEATHNILQNWLPPSVRERYEAAHSHDIVLPAETYKTAFAYDVEVSQNRVLEVHRYYWWHPSLGAGVITSSGFLLQPNIQERDFSRCAPMLESLDPAMVHQWYQDFAANSRAGGVSQL